VYETQSCIVSGDDVVKLFGSDVLGTMPELLQKEGTEGRSSTISTVTVVKLRQIRMTRYAARIGQGKCIQNFGEIFE